MRRQSPAAPGMLALTLLAWAAMPAAGADASNLPRSGRASNTVADTDCRVTQTVRAIRRARSSTVNIHTERRAQTSDALFAASRDRKVNGMGTGIVIDERGYIVTNHHVVADVDTLRVTLFDGTPHIARVVSFDRRQDLAIIKIDAGRALETLPLGTSSDLMLGEDVLAIGNAFGYEHTVTRGIVSSLTRDVEVNAEQAYENLIQIDAAINPGNSGGPLLNAKGDVVGINVAIRAGAQKIGFAIPIDDARRIIARLMSVEKLEKRSHGVVLEDRKNGPSRELIVAHVHPNGPAAAAGIQPGDRIRTVDGRPTLDSADFERLLLGRGIADRIVLDLDRQGDNVSTQVRLQPIGRGHHVASHPAVRAMTAVNSAPARSAGSEVPQNRPTPRVKAGTVSEKSAARHRTNAVPRDTWADFGLRLQETDDLRSLQGTKFKGGLLVASVRQGSIAEKEHIRRGDLLVGLNGYETLSMTSLGYILKKVSPTATEVPFYVQRRGETFVGSFKTAR